MPLLEVSEGSGLSINNYDSQNIRNTLDHYLSELKRKRMNIPAADETALQVRIIKCLLPCILKHLFDAFISHFTEAPPTLGSPMMMLAVM